MKYTALNLLVNGVHNLADGRDGICKEILERAHNVRYGFLDHFHCVRHLYHHLVTESLIIT